MNGTSRPCHRPFTFGPSMIETISFKLFSGLSSACEIQWVSSRIYCKSFFFFFWLIHYILE